MITYRGSEKQKATHVAYREANKDKIKAYREANKEKYRATSAKWYAENREKAISYERLKTTGVTQEQYDGAYLKQAGLCAICSCECPSGMKLAADHCHTTGKFRGFLCKGCNLALGLFKDSEATMRNALTYLQRARGNHT